MKLTRALDPAEIRILGSLLEKQQSTPDYYPMTVNSLVAACNQKSNRDPLMELGEEQVSNALDRLQQQVLVWKVMGGRTVHWKHNLDGPWQLSPPQKAVMTLLLLRGEQTAAELRSRSDRLHPLGSREEAEELLKTMSSDPEPLVTELPRMPGRKETRWMHLAGGAPLPITSGPEAAVPTLVRSLDFVSRIEQLESEVQSLRRDLAELKEKLGED
ncbi:MAG: YceH family protein [Acidobacteriota bacterium]